MRGKGISVVLALALASMLVGTVTAQGEEPLPPCAGEGVSGTVVGVDEATGIVTLYTAEGLCTVTLEEGEYDHPIAALLGTFFGDVSTADLVEALEVAQGCAIEEGGTWQWSDCSAEGAVPVTVIGEEDGAFVALMEEGERIVLTVEDPEAAEALDRALEALTVEWRLNEEGVVVQPGEQIAAYHEQGIGFGVLVKLYAMASALPDVTVDDLVAAFQSGTGMGELFQEFGRPSILGVGHVRDRERGNGNHLGQIRHSERIGPPGLVGRSEGDQHPGRGHGWGRIEPPGQARGRNK